MLAENHLFKIHSTTQTNRPSNPRPKKQSPFNTSLSTFEKPRHESQQPTKRIDSINQYPRRPLSTLALVFSPHVAAAAESPKFRRSRRPRAYRFRLAAARKNDRARARDYIRRRGSANGPLKS